VIAFGEKGLLLLLQLHLLHLLSHWSQGDLLAPDLDLALFEDLVGQGHLIKDHLAIYHLVDGLALDIEVDQLLAGHLGVEHVPDLIPGDSHGDWPKENLLLDWPPGVHFWAPVVVWQLSRGRCWGRWG